MDRLYGKTSRRPIAPRSADAREVKRAIEHALAERAEREAQRINVKVDHGVAVLTGCIHSWSDRTAAIGAARQIPGVSRVRDELQIDPLDF